MFRDLGFRLLGLGFQCLGFGGAGADLRFESRSFCGVGDI